jgi:DNA-binding MarR family transcriptional regulator
MKMIDPNQLSSEVIELVGRLTRLAAELESDLLNEAEFSDLSIRQIYYLDLIHDLDNPTPTELARRLNISKASVSIAIDRLESVGYVRKVRSDADRRSFHLHLTERGEVFTRAHDEFHRHLAAELTRNLDAHDLRTLTGVAKKILDR